MARRRQFTLENKRQLVEETCQPGASVASVAMTHQINANQLHKWRRELLTPARPDTISGQILVPVSVVDEFTEPATIRTPVQPDTHIEIVLPRARVILRGAVDPDALQTTLTILSRR
jgi:transposase